ncbi:MAG TPA: protease HtpX, partial [Steroidobacteraceae bacterium]|nr:protease HtpX [Steroidobacteraceae bacterium]
MLFLLTNLAILLMLTLIVRITGADSWLAARGMNLPALLLLAALFGFAGSLSSLAMSKWLAIRSLGVQRIEQPSSAAEQWLLETVQRLA